ncbi:hypothetical protein LRC537489_41130 [Mycobacterium riyadhense]
MENTSGTIAALATIDASPALWWRCNTSQGKTSIEIPTPIAVVNVANIIRDAGTRLQLLMAIRNIRAKAVGNPPIPAATSERRVYMCSYAPPLHGSR